MSLRGFASALRLLSNFKQAPLKSPFAKVSITEFFLTLRGRGYLMSAPTGLWSKAQGWRLGRQSQRLPWVDWQCERQPQRGCGPRSNATPLGLWRFDVNPNPG